jgi:tRNA pseudouridine55 synthase
MFSSLARFHREPGRLPGSPFQSECVIVIAAAGAQPALRHPGGFPAIYSMSTSLFHGLLVLDKPAGLTSRDAVDRAQRWFPKGTRIGHTGTLDPLATGVLVLTVGAATRLAEYVQRMEKTYRTTIRLGATSNSDDCEGTIVPTNAAQLPDRAAVDRVVGEFIGEIDQVPPAFSAVNVTGQRAYRLARRGKPVSLTSRRIRVHAIDVLAYEYPRLELEVRCGKGTYIRSLARDIGQRLSCGGYVESLRRMRVGPFAPESAVGFDAQRETVLSHLFPLGIAVADLPRLALADDRIETLRHGRPLTLEKTDSQDREGIEEVAVFDGAGDLAAITRIDDQGRLIPVKVFADPASEPRSPAARG